MRTRESSRWTVLAVATAVALAGCASETTGGAAGGESAQVGGAAISVNGIAFKPASLGILAGDAVTWTLDEPTEHTVTAGTPAAPLGTFDEVLRKEGDRFEFAFEDPGDYPFFCRRHPNGMRGEITVT